MNREQGPGRAMWVIAATLALAWAPTTTAQDYPVRNYTADDGLPSPTVRSMVQDKTGVMWFATETGVVTFDGLLWREVDPSGLGIRRGSARLATDDSGRVWAYFPTLERPVMIRSGRGWSPVAVPAGLSGYGIHVHEVAAGGGPDEEVFALATVDDGAWWFAGGGWRHLDLDSGLDTLQVRGVAVSGRDLWVANARTLFRCEPETGACEAAFRAAAGEEILAVDSAALDGSIWLMTSARLLARRGSAWHEVSGGLDLRWSYPYPPRLEVDGRDFALCANRVTVEVVSLKTGERRQLGPENGLSNSGATALLVDRERNLWISGTRGVSKIPTLRFATFGREHGLLEDEVAALAETGPGEFVAGHNNGVTIIAGGGFRHHRFPDPGPDELIHGARRVQEIWPDGSGGAWFAASELGLGFISPSGELEWVRTRPPLPRPVNTVAGLADGRLLVGTEGGLHVVSEGRATRVGGEPVLTQAIRRVRAQPDGTVWVAGTALVKMIDGRVEEVFQPVEGDPHGVYCVAEDAFGRVWTGTRSGLYQARDGRLEPPSRRDLQFGFSVYFVLEDRDGRLWFGSDDGVLLWDGHDLRHFGPAEGLAGRDANRAAAILDHAGQVWIGTEGGLSRYQSGFDLLQKPVYKVRLEEIEVAGHRIPAISDASLKWHQNTVEFRYRAPSFVAQRRLVYAYWLEGFDEGWSSPVSAHQRSVRYTNLSAGRYRLHVRAATGDGEWSAPAVSGWITISQPFWNRWWFVVLSGALVGVAGWGTAVLVSRGRRTGRLETEVASRIRKQSESEERYRLLFDHSSQATLVVEPDGHRVVEANAAIRDLLDSDRAEVAGRTLEEAGLGWLDRELRRSAGGREGGASHGVRTVRTGERGERRLEFWIDDIPMDGRLYRLISVHDVTERRQREEEFFRLSKLESLSGLARGIANDFNNVLAASIGQISLAQMRIPGEASDVRNLLDEAQAGLLGARHLTDQLLSFASTGDLETSVVDLGALLRDSVALARSGLGLRCATTIPPGFWYVAADPPRLAQVFTNLLLNAHQASPEGGVVTVSCRNLRSEEAPKDLGRGRFVEVVVEDSGEGMSQDVLERAFDPYFSTRERSVGLGLATAFVIVREHGGRIDLESSPSRGTRVRVVLPAVPVSGPPPVESERSRAGAGRVLAMDDEPELRALYRDILGVMGYEVVAVPDGESAVEHYTRARGEGSPFDLVILDLTVHDGMGGADTMAALRRIDPGVRALVASGYTTDPVMSAHENAGFVAAIRKPFTVAQLARVVAEAIGGVESETREPD